MIFVKKKIQSRICFLKHLIRSQEKNSGTAGPDKYHPCYSLAMSKDKDIIAMLFCTQEIWREAIEALSCFIYSLQC